MFSYNVRHLTGAVITATLWGVAALSAQAQDTTADKSGPATLAYKGVTLTPTGFFTMDALWRQRNETADTGDIVVALIDDEEATLKRFRRRGASIALEPANTAYEVRILPPNRVKIQGKLVGLYRKY